MRLNITQIALLSCILLAGIAIGHSEALGIDNRDIIGLSDNGTVYLTDPGCLGSCYDAVNPVTGSVTLPGLGPSPSLLDDGTACTPTGLPTDAVVTVSHSVCNGGIDAFSANVYFDSPSECPPNSPTCVLNDGELRGFFLNSVDDPIDLWADSIFVSSSGYIAWDDGIVDQDYEIGPLLPEPPTLLLLGTGLLAFSTLMRRKLRSAPSSGKRQPRLAQ